MPSVHDRGGIATAFLGPILAERVDKTPWSAVLPRPLTRLTSPGAPIRLVQEEAALVTQRQAGVKYGGKGDKQHLGGRRAL